MCVCVCFQDAKIEPEEFTTRLQAELKSSPQPYLIPFLKVPPGGGVFLERRRLTGVFSPAGWRCRLLEKPPGSAPVSAQQPAVPGHRPRPHAAAGRPRLCRRHRHTPSRAHQSGRHHRQTERAAHEHRGTSVAHFLFPVVTLRFGLCVFSNVTSNYSLEGLNEGLIRTCWLNQPASAVLSSFLQAVGRTGVQTVQTRTPVVFNQTIRPQGEPQPPVLDQQAAAARRRRRRAPLPL